MNWQTINEVDGAGVLVHKDQLFMGCRRVIKVYDLSSKTLYREIGKGIFASNFVRGLVIHKNTLLATDQTNKLHVFDIDGKHQNSFTVEGMSQGRGMAIHNHKLFICDGSGRCVRVVNPDTGKLLKTIGSQGDGKDQFSYPSFITSADNRLYVTEYGNNRVKVMDEQGTFVDQFSASNPTGIAISGKDIIVSEYGKGQVSLYDKNHKFAKVLLECSDPWGVFITDRGQVIVAAGDSEIHISGTAGVYTDVVVSYNLIRLFV